MHIVVYVFANSVILSFSAEAIHNGYTFEAVNRILFQHERFAGVHRVIVSNREANSAC